MPFQMLIEDRAYQARLAADNSEGRCAGQSVTWVLDILENKVDSLRPADLDRGARYQDKFSIMYDSHSRGGVTANEYLLKAVAYSAKNPPVRTAVSSSIKDEVFVTSDGARKLVDKLAASTGNAFLLMYWEDAKSAHMMALTKIKNGRVYLYEPNGGVLQYGVGALSLHDEIKQFLIQRRILVRNPELRMSLLLSTPLDLGINL